MNQTHIICRHLLTGLAIGTCLVTTGFAQEADLVGSWNCNLDMSDPSAGAAVTAALKVTYDADSTYTSNGEMRISIPALQISLTVGIDEAGNWRLVESTVIGQTPTSLELSSKEATPTQMAQMMLQQMQTEAKGSLAQEETSRIDSITSTRLQLSTEGGGDVACEKADQ